MFKNYFKIAWRNLVKNKKSSLINIGGLAIGMAVAVLIGLWIWDELSFNKYHKNYERVAQVMQHQTWNGEVGTGQAIPMPLGEELRKTYGDDFKYIAMASWQGDHIITDNNKYLSKNGMFIDKDGPKILALEMLHGSQDGLKEPGSIMISASAAKAFFGKADPINKLMKVDNRLDVKVTGVFKDLPYNTDFKDLSFLAPWSLYLTSEDWLKNAATDWGNNSFQLFAEINSNTHINAVNKRIINAKLNQQSEEDKKYKAQIFLHPMNNWHLRSSWKAGFADGGKIEYVKMFATIGLFVLLLACINFMNLSTARSERRAKEIGIRKTVGSRRMQLISQFLCESILVSFIAFILALVIVQLLLPWFNEVADKKMYILFSNPLFWLIGLGFTFLTGLIAGSYPALYLSSFNAIKVLKGTFKVGRFAALPRKVLVVIQFTVSIALIIGTIIIYQQIQYSKNRPIGYNRNGLVMVSIKTQEIFDKREVLKTELKKTNVITEMAASNSPLTAVWTNDGGYNWQGKDPDLDTDIAVVWVTKEYGKTVGFEIKEGRDFSKDFPGDSTSIVINEAAVKFMGIKDPVGKVITQGRDDNMQRMTIIGVVKDMIMSSPYEPVKQTFYRPDRDNINWLLFRLNPDKSVSQSLAAMEKVFKANIMSSPFAYEFAEDGYASKFTEEVRVGKLASFFTGLAILISCLGLFGLASFVAEQRTKEIGIRKIVGASVFNLWKLLSKDFIFLVGLSCLIAMPLGYYYLNNWLKQYDYRIDISWWVFAAAVGGAIMITLLTVSFQAIKAALANPVKSLRSE
ncbi:MAG: ABC transporter permease [Rhizobacter sp.]|nr:ABC transporter permease [Ferruginibacter sp.]